MAKVDSSLKAAGVLAGGAAFLALLLLSQGCARQQVADNLPPPNFNGPTLVQPDRPVVVQRPSVQQAPPQPKPDAKAKPQVAQVPGGIPRDWIPRPGAERRQWKWIVIHHTATPGGNLALVDKMHKDKGWDGCGYHFVIGNGTDSGDGKVEPSYRWQVQKWGAHAKTPDNEYNEHGIGICLVGNFDIDRPTAAQLASLTKLVGYLARTYDISQSRIIGHRETKATDCPGKNVNIAGIRRAVAQVANVSEGRAEPADETGVASTSRGTDDAAATGAAPTTELLISHAGRNP